MAGSDPFLGLPAVKAVFRRHGLALQQYPLGSLQILGQASLSKSFGLANTGSAEAGTLVQGRLRKAGINAQIAGLYDSPIVILTYQPIVRLLESIGVVRQTGHLLIFDIGAYLHRVVGQNLRWTGIRGNQSYRSLNRVLVWTTDPESSNSGATFAAIVSSAQLHDDPVTSVTPAGSYLGLARKCFMEQGSMLPHTPDLLQQFLAGGIDTYPMAVVYENDYILERLSDPKDLPPGLAVMYPSPTADPENTFVSWTGPGRRVISLLTTNPVLIRLEEQYGYRTSQDGNGFVRYMASRGIAVPSLQAPTAGLQFTHLPSDTVLQALGKAVVHG
jgi:hypothetical protein